MPELPINALAPPMPELPINALAPQGTDQLAQFRLWLANLGMQQTLPAPQSADAPWVQNLKRLVQPQIDPRAVLPPQYQNTDPMLNRLGPKVGSQFQV